MQSLTYQNVPIKNGKKNVFYWIVNGQFIFYKDSEIYEEGFNFLAGLLENQIPFKAHVC